MVRKKLVSVMKYCYTGFLVSVSIIAAMPQQSAPVPTQAKKIRFETDILPILNQRCVLCHGNQTMAKSMNLSSYSGTIKGSESGAVVVAGKPDESLLFKKVHEGEMPKGGLPLSATEVNAIREWIASGALSAITFEEAVAPILQANCTQCHGSAARLKNLDLSTFAGLVNGGESGPVITPGKPDESRLYTMIHEGQMPKGGKPLTADQIAIIGEWIKAGAPSVSPVAMARTEPLAEDDILPVVLLRCAGCHGPHQREGGLALHTREAMLKGGKSGPALLPGKPDQSLMVQKIRSGEMPPKVDNFGLEKFSPSETEKLVAWIAEGAPQNKMKPDAQGVGHDPLVSDTDRNFWAFQRPKRPPVPSVRHSDRVRNPVDAFIVSKLEAKGLEPSPGADKLTLARRAYMDLTGLPPMVDEVQAFLSDQDPQAYEKLIDRLLASPRYGERWGQYWLDLAGYADSEGGKVDADAVRPNAWRYRDYVIRSFNADKPYNRFLLEQIAGDELVDYEHSSAINQEALDNLIATGFLRMGPDSTYINESTSVADRLDVIADELEVLGSGVMGLTVTCARCHSHKYDPIPQRDYYRLLDIFKGAFDYYDWLPPQTSRSVPARARYLPYVTPGATPVQLLEQVQGREFRNSVFEKKIVSLKSSLEKKAEPLKKQILDQRLAQLAPSLQADLRKVLDTPTDQRNDIQKYLADKFENILKIETQDLKKADFSYRKAAEEADREIKLLEAQKEPEPLIRALWDRGDPTATYVLRRGDPADPGPLVSPGVPAVLVDGKTPFVVKPPWPGARPTAGRRLAFAQWLTRPDNPVTARVAVNQLWARHFGTGIVKTPRNFGRTGSPPTHPDLLDWLATEFARQGWSFKEMHRLIMTSNTYRQSSAVTPALEKSDPDNVLLSRMLLRRMDAEQLYDTLLAVSGHLDETQHGPPEPVEVRDDGLITPIPTQKGWRRAIYVAQRRTETPTLLKSFDLPPMSPNCVERNVSTVASQALHLMNDRMVESLAKLFAERLIHEVGTDPRRQIGRAYWIALSRPPSSEEESVSVRAIDRFRALTTGKDQTKTPPSQQASPFDGQAMRTVHAREIVGDVPGDIRGLAEFCHALLNSAAFIYVD